MIVRAKFVVPVTGPIVENGAVTVSEGKIANVASWPASGGCCDHDFGEAVLLPGLVNGHTHLELSHLHGQVDPAVGFVDWLQGLSRLVRAENNPQTSEASVTRGARECVQHGVTTVGDITRLPSVTRAVLREGPLRVVSYGEVIAIGTGRRALNDRLQVAAAADEVSDYLRIGISPHAPYTVEPDGFHACRQRADRLDLPMTIHLAETPDERSFTTAHQGSLRVFLERVGVWDDDVACPSASPVEFLERVGCLSWRTLLVHVNYVTAAEIEIIAQGGAHVAYCPRTHAAFDHAPHPFRTMLDAGVNVCLGTDSLASNPSLSVLDEARTLYAKYPDVGVETCIEMITVRGARALSCGDGAGSLALGSPADMTVIRLDAGGPVDPLENILRSEEMAVETWVGGRRVYETPATPPLNS